MTVDVVMPKMGESIQEGKILQWLKKEGETIERDEIILEISTDKVDTEVPAPNSGVLSKILVGEDETVEVGTVIAQIETEGSASGNAASAAVSEEPAAATPAAIPAVEHAANATIQAAPAPAVAATAAAATVDVVMPKMGESIQEGTVLQWLKKEGEAIERDEIILEISTDKVDTEVPSPVSGTLAQVLAAEGDTVEVGTVIAKIATGEAPAAVETTAPASTPSAPAPVPAQAAAAGNGQVAAPAGGTTVIPRRRGDRFYSPLVRTIAEQEKVTLEELEGIRGSGLDGRVNKKDILSFIEQRGKAPAISPAPAVEPPTPAAAPTEKATRPAAAPVASEQLDDEQLRRKYGQDIEIVPMDHIRQLIADHMVHSKHTSPHVTSVAEVDVTDIVRFREKVKADFLSREGVKLTVTPFFCRAVVEGLRAFPMVNVSVEGKKIVRHKHINLGVATVLPDGNLIVPVIKDADALNITGLARSVADLATRARSRKLMPDEIQGGTITLTNVGGFGTLFGTPVINQPQVAIIGVGAIQKRPVVKEIEGNDMILVRHMLYVSITYDHRVVDGALAGQCLAAICKGLEEMNEQTIVL